MAPWWVLDWDVRGVRLSRQNNPSQAKIQPCTETGQSKREPCCLKIWTPYLFFSFPITINNYVYFIHKYKCRIRRTRPRIWWSHFGEATTPWAERIQYSYNFGAGKSGMSNNHKVSWKYKVWWFLVVWNCRLLFMTIMMNAMHICNASRFILHSMSSHNPQKNICTP